MSERCDLCGRSMRPDEFSRGAHEATGLNICPDCLEDTLDASANQPRCEVGLVGSSGQRP